MNLEKAIRNINRSLAKKQPASFSPIWIKYRCKVSYQFIIKNIKTELNDPNWDYIVSQLERCNQKLWLKDRKRKNKPVLKYSDKNELEVILKSHGDKLYTFIACQNKEDKRICDWISIKLVRIAQKGNILAKDKITVLLVYLIDQWIEYDRSLFSWKGYNELITEQIEACIRRFRYAGSFLGYLYRTLEYSGRGLVPLEKFSLDDISTVSGKRLIETFVIKSGKVR
ncbi:MAG: hypothetical protein MUF50_01575 [Planctomycetes bacterium]|jgi:hypothetical protein|nr:hypothetical protein [Planctomycetota bacterium]